MPTICFISYEFFPTTWGGCGVLLYNLCSELLRNGFKVILAVDIPREYFKKLTSQDSKLMPNNQNLSVFLVEDLIDDGLRANDFKTLFEWHAYRFYLAAKHIDESHDVDLFEFFDYCGPAYCTLNAKLSGIAFQSTNIAIRLHNSLEVMDANESTTVHNFARYRAFALEHAALNKAEYILYPTKRYLENAYKPYYEPWNAVELHAPPPIVTWPDTHESCERKDIFLFYGRLFSWKGVDLFVDAAVSFLDRTGSSEAKFYIVGYDSNSPPTGDGTYTDYLEGKIPEDMREKFYFPGHLSWTQLEDFLPRVRAAVFPSYFESFCYAAHELYNAGIPILVSNTPAFQDYFFNEENALTFDLTVNSLTECMIYAHKRPELLSAISRRKEVIKQNGSTDVYARLTEQKKRSASREKKMPSLEKGLLILMSDVTNLNDSGFSLSSDHEPSCQVILASTNSNSKAPSCMFLGKSVVFYHPDGTALMPTSVVTGDWLLILNDTDALEPAYFDKVLPALSRENVGFINVWKKSVSGTAITDPIDAIPETKGFFDTDALSRALLKTKRDMLLLDLFDHRAKSLGEIDYMLRLSKKYYGITIPEVLMSNIKISAEDPDLKDRSYLTLKEVSPVIMRRLARLALVLKSEGVSVPSDSSAHFSQDVEDVLRKVVARMQNYYDKYPFVRRFLSGIFSALKKI